MVGRISTEQKVVCDLVFGAICPGYFMIQGFRTPPSKLVPFGSVDILVE
jgi:hypothetical protein